MGPVNRQPRVSSMLMLVSGEADAVGTALSLIDLINLLEYSGLDRSGLRATKDSRLSSESTGRLM
jgi:hypothetical protein